jgi:hypothetical protein
VHMAGRARADAAAQCQEFVDTGVAYGFHHGLSRLTLDSELLSLPVNYN